MLMPSFSSSFLHEKRSEVFLCLQKAISLFLAVASSEVKESSCLLYVAGFSSHGFKDFKVPQTEVQQRCDTSSRKTRWWIFRSTFFVLCSAREPKSLQKPKTYCSPGNTMHSLFSYSSQNVIWSSWRKCVPKSSSLLVTKLTPTWHYIKCHLFHVLVFFAQISGNIWSFWEARHKTAEKCVYTQISYVSQHAFLCHVFYADLFLSLSSLFGFRAVTFS